MKRILAALSALTLTGTLLTGTAHAAPVAGGYTPSNGARVALDVPLLIAGGATNGESGDVTAVDITFDGGQTWLPTEYQGERWLYRYTPTEEGEVTYHLRAWGSGGPGGVRGPFRFFAGGTAEPPTPDCPCLLGLPALPHRPEVDDPDQAPVEVGVRVRVDSPGYLVGAFIHRGTHTGPLTAHLWSADGTLLAEAVSPAERYVSDVDFPTPVPVVPGQEYVVSYFTPAGGYRVTEDYFSAAMATAPYATSEGAGVYSYGGGFPTQSWNNSNYWVRPIMHTRTNG
ncbi:DUF4082 domain-containing protein [Saccharothrix syringae]|uniref:DUF4082 domain-containing protein n=1 Tax=Saccharothrix syringae TaxID=103733 RepID=UPI000527348F|nr:DUF4082 domain-containing protein [Saccharothrix syringae]